jgi:hypothetical protein
MVYGDLLFYQLVSSLHWGSIEWCHLLSWLQLVFTILCYTDYKLARIQKGFGGTCVHRMILPQSSFWCRTTLLLCPTLGPGHVEANHAPIAWNRNQWSVLVAGVDFGELAAAWWLGTGEFISNWFLGPKVSRWDGSIWPLVKSTTLLSDSFTLMR